MYFCVRICVYGGSPLRLTNTISFRRPKEITVEENTPILAAMSDVAGVSGGDISFHSSSTSPPSEECKEGGSGEEIVNVA